MVDIPGALDFIQQHGTDIHFALAEFAVGITLSQTVTPALVLKQHPGGGWMGFTPGVPIHLATLSDAVRVLQWMRWMGAENHPLVDRTAVYLAGKQHPNGYWDEVPELTPHNPPVGMIPGQRETQVLLTATIARMLMETGRDTEVYFGRALNFLSDAWERGDVVHAPITAAAHMFPLFKIGGQTTDNHIVDGCMALLGGAVHSADPADVIIIAHAGLNTRYAGNKLYVTARDRALTFQAADGGWKTSRGTLQRVNSTVDALMLLRWGGMLS